MNKYQEDALKRHNELRQRHNISEICWNNELGNKAKRYAEYLAENDIIKHDTSCNEGENIVYLKGGELSGKISTNVWYNEGKFYDYKNRVYQVRFGHFTQLIWKNSTLFGYGQAKSKSGATYAVARYYPTGNVDNQFEKNIFPPIIPPSIIRISPEFPDMSEEEYLAIETHNKYRKLHGVEPLIWSKDLKLKAIEFCHYYEVTTNLTNNDNIHYGVNTSIISSLEPSAKSIIESYYVESEHYNYEDPDEKDESTNGFTQLVWKNTKEMGYATLQINDNETVVVILYSPKGNIEGEYKQNVFPKTTDEPHQEIENVRILDDEQNKFLYLHNKYRKVHGCNDLEWSWTLHDESMKYLETISNNDIIFKDHSTTRGEIIGYEWNITETNYEIIKTWYQENVYYDYNDPKSSHLYSNFTQIVWKSTKYMGYASNKTDDGLILYVFRYWPPGNISGLYSENVLPKSIKPPKKPYIYEEYKNWILKYHNIYRKKHRSPILNLSLNLCHNAENVALTMIHIKNNYSNFGSLNSLEHKINFLYGHESKLPNPKTACKVWYNTFLCFSYDLEKVYPQSGPFCNMIWASTLEIGVGVASSKNKSVVVVLYRNNNNDDGKIQKNIKRPLEKYDTISKK